MVEYDGAIPAGERAADRERATVRTRNRSSAQLDVAFELLADARRRYAIYCLRTRDQPIGVADLAGDVAAELRDEPVDAVPDDAVEATYAALYHVHLPKLDDEGIVRFRRDRACVSIGENEDALAPYLSLAAGEEL